MLNETFSVIFKHRAVDSTHFFDAFGCIILLKGARARSTLQTCNNDASRKAERREARNSPQENKEALHHDRKSQKKLSETILRSATTHEQGKDLSFLLQL